MERCSVLVEDGEGWRRIPQPCSFGKSGSPEASGDGGGRLGQSSKKVLAHFCGNHRQQVKVAARVFVFCKTIFLLSGISSYCK